MKATVFALCILCATAALGQISSTNSPVLASTTQPAIHPQHASLQSLAQEQNLLGSGTITIGQGEMPLSEVPLPVVHVVPLGDSARMLKKEHATAKKAERIWTD